MASYLNTKGETDETARLSCSAVVGGARDVDADEAAHAVPPLAQIDLDTRAIPELSALSDADVDALLADSALLDAFAAALPPVVDNAPAAARCRALEAELKALAAQTAPLFAEAAAQRAALDAASARHRAAVDAQRAVDARLSAAGLAAVLEAADAAADAASAELVDKFRAGELAPEAFARAYHAARTELYTLRMKRAALTQQPFP